MLPHGGVISTGASPTEARIHGHASAGGPANSSQRATADNDHWTEVCCGLNLVTDTVAPHRTQVTGEAARNRCQLAASAPRASRTARFSATSACQPSTARVVSTSNSYRSTIDGSMSSVSE